MAKMAEGTNSGARLICVLSHAYQRSEYCRAEYEQALHGDPRNLNQRVIVMSVDQHIAGSDHLANIPRKPLWQHKADALRTRLRRWRIRSCNSRQLSWGTCSAKAKPLTVAR